MPTALRADKVIETAAKLQLRISERFPESGLSKVASQVQTLAERGAERSALIARPYWALRGLSALFAVSVIGLSAWTIKELGFRNFKQTQDFVSFVESAIGTLVFVGASLFFVLSLEDRLKRRRALAALHELRSLAHVIDMHQLTKDPERLLIQGPDTESSPQRTMTSFELSRYLDYCVELLSLVSKIAALYVENHHDSVAVNAVDQIEAMTTGLSRKIWQKISLLSSVEA